jgi:acyl-CoA thioesterase FadM
VSDLFYPLRRHTTVDVQARSRGGAKIAHMAISESGLFYYFESCFCSSMLVFTTRVLWHLLMGKLRPPLPANKSVSIEMRCSPLDIDSYLHMNNASYLRVAELCRWRVFPATGVFGAALKEKMMFLAVEQKISYKKPIQCFQKFAVVTKADIFKDDKWIWYEHVFQQHPDDVKPGVNPVVFAKIELRAVMKQQNGKTVNPSCHIERSPFVANFYSKHDIERPVKPMEV